MPKFHKGNLLFRGHFMSRSTSSLLFLDLGEGFATKIDRQKTGTLILTSLLEDLGVYSTMELGPLSETWGCGKVRCSYAQMEDSRKLRERANPNFFVRLSFCPPKFAWQALSEP